MFIKSLFISSVVTDSFLRLLFPFTLLSSGYLTASIKFWLIFGSTKITLSWSSIIEFNRWNDCRSIIPCLIIGLTPGLLKGDKSYRSLKRNESWSLIKPPLSILFRDLCLVMWTGDWDVVRICRKGVAWTTFISYRGGPVIWKNSSSSNCLDFCGLSFKSDSPRLNVL